MSDLDREHARALCLDFLAACRSAASGQAHVTDSFRCWTPLHDWATGADGLSALTHVLRPAAAVGGVPAFTAHSVISDGETVVIEADIQAVHEGEPVSCTFVVGLQAGLVKDIRCYFDPRAVEG